MNPTPDVAEREPTAEQLRQLYAEAQQRAREQESLVRIAALAGSTLDAHEILDRAMEEVRQLVGAESVVVLLADPEKRSLDGRYVATGGHVMAAPAEWSIPMDAPGFEQSIFARGGVYYSNQGLADPHLIPAYRPYMEHLRVQNFCGVALRTRERSIGELYLVNRPGGMGPDQLRLLRTIAGYITNAIENARLFENAERARREQERRSEQLSALHEVALELAQEQRGLDTVLATLTRRTMSLLTADGGGVWLWREEDQELELAVTFQVGGTEMTGRRLKPGEGLTGRAFTARQTLAIDDYLTWDGRSPTFADAPFHAALAVPMIWQNRVLGVLAVTRSQRGSPFTSDERRLAELLAGQAAVALENLRWRQEMQAAWHALARRTAEQDALLNNIPDTIYFKDLESRFTRINPAQARVLGVSDPQEAVGKSDFDFWTTESAQAAYADEQRIIESGQPIIGRVEQIVRKENGQTHWFSATKIPLTDATGQVVGLVGISRDITDLKEAQDAAQRRATELQTAAEVSRAASSILDPDELVQQVVNLVRDGFDLYYVGLFLVDETGAWTGEPGKWAVLRAGTGEAGRQMAAQGHKLEIGGASMIGWCLAHQQARIALDVGAEAVRFDNPLLPETRSELALPLISRGRIIGAMTVQSRQPAAFSPEDIAALQIMADQLANAVENARLFQAEQRRRQETETLQQASLTLGSTLDADQVLEQLLDQIGQAIPYDCANVMWIENGIVRITHQRGYERLGTAEANVAFRMPVEQLPDLHQMYTTRRPHVVPDTASAPHWVRREPTRWIRSWAGAPIVVGDQVVGFFSLDSATPGFYTPEHADLLAAFAAHAAIAIQNARLFEAVQQTNILLEQRVRELNCLNEIGRKMDEAPPIEEFLQWAAARVPSAMRHPEVCVAAIEFAGQVYGAPAAMESPYQIVQGLRIGGEQVGQVYIAYTERREFPDGASALLGDIVRRLSGYIENRRLFEQTQAALAETRALYDLSRSVISVEDLPSILQTAANHIAELLPAHRVAIQHVDLEARRVLHFAKGGPGAQQHVSVSFDELWDGLAGWAMRELQPALSPKGILDPRESPAVQQRRAETQCGAIVVVPLRYRDQTQGIISAINRPDERDFTQRDVELLATMASQVAIAIENARLFEQTQARAEELAALNEMSQGLAATLELDRVFESIYHYTSRLIDTTNFYLALYDPATDEVSFPLAVEEGQRVPWRSRRAGQGLTEHVIRTGQPLLIPEQVDHWLARVGIESIGRAAQSWLGVPMAVGGQVLGVLAVQDYTTPRRYDEHHRDLLTAIASQAAIAIQNARLFAKTQQASAQLAEQVKLLDCLSDIGRQIGQTPPIPEFLHWVAGRIPQAMQYPEACVVAIQFNGQVYGAPAARELPRQMVQSLHLGGAEVGRVYVAYTEEHDFLDRESALLGDVVRRVSGYLESRRLFEQARRRAEELAALNELAQSLAARLNLDQVLEEVYRGVSRLLDTTNFFIGLYDPAKNEISYPINVTESGVDKDIVVLPADQGLSGYIVRHRTSLLLTEDVPAWYERMGVEVVGQVAQSWLGAPLLLGDQVLGLLAVQDFTRAHVYDEHDRELLVAIASQAAIAIQNARLFDETRRRAQQLAVVNEIGQAVSAALKLDDLLPVLLQQVGRLFDVTNFYVALYYEDTDEWASPLHLEHGQPQPIVRRKVTAGLTGHIIRTRQPLLFRTREEILAFQQAQRIATIGETAQSWMGVPLIAAEKVLGVMTIQSYERAALYSAEELALFSTIADQVAAAIANLRLLDETRRRAQELEAINDVGRTVASVLDLNAVLRQIVDATKARFGFYYVDILMVEDGQLIFQDGSTIGSSEVRLARGQFALDLQGPGLTTEAARTGQPVLVNDVSQDPRYIYRAEFPATRSELCCPVTVKGRVIGVLDVQQDQPHAFSPSDVALILSLANQIGGAIENARLFHEESRARALLDVRVKELDCLSDIGRKIGEAPPTPEFLDWLAQRIPAAMQYPDICVAAIEFEGRVYGVAEAMQLPWQMVQGLRVGGDLVGQIYIAYTQEREFLDAESALLGDIARRVSGYIENRRLFEQTQAALAETETRVREMQILQRIIQAVSATLDLDHVLDALVSTLAQELGFTYIAISVIDEPTRSLRTVRATGLAQGLLGLVRPFEQLQGDILMDVIRTRQAEVIDGWDDRFDREIYEREGHAELVRAFVPLLLRDRAVGVLEVGYRRVERARITESEVQLLRSMTDQAAVALENVRLFDQARQVSTLLRGRVEELDCLNDIGRKIDEAPPIPEFLSWVARRIPAAMPYPEICLTAIEYEGQVYGAPQAMELPYQVVQSIRIGGQAVGRVYIAYTERRDFPDAVSALLGDVVRRVSGYLENRRLFEQTQAALAETETLYRAGQAISRLAGVQETFQALATAMVEQLGYATAWMAVVDRRTNTVRGLAGAGPGVTETIIRDEVPLDPGLRNPVAITVFQRQPLIINNVATDERAADLLEETRRFIGRVLEVPILLGEEVAGVIAVSRPLSSPPLTERDRDLVVGVANQAAAAIRNARLLDQLQRRAAQLAAAAEVAQRATAILNLEQLLDETVHLISERFGFYHAGVFLRDDAGEYVVLRAASSEGGQRMLARGHRLAVGQVGIVGYVAGAGQPRIALDVGADAVFFDNPDLPQTRSEMALPLIARGRVIGVLDVQSVEPAAFSEEDVAVLHTMANQLATAIQNVRLLEETERRAAQTQALYEASQLVSRLGEDLEAGLRGFFERLEAVAAFDRWWVPLLEEDELAFRGLVGRWENMSAEDMRRRVVLADEPRNPVVLAIQTRQTIVINDPERDERLADLPPYIRRAAGRYVTEPIWVGERVIGAVSLGRRADSAPISAEDMELARTIAAQIGLAVENRRLFEQTQAALAEAESLYETSRRLAAAADMQEIIAAVVEGLRTPAINRAVIWALEYDAAGQPTALTSLANWYKGEGTPPLPVGTRFSLAQFPATQLTLAGEPLFFADTQHDDRLDAATQAVFRAQNVRGMALLPLRGGARQVGVMMLVSEQPHHFTESETRPYLSLAGQLAFVIENRRLFEQTQAALAQTAALYEASQAITAARSREEVVAALTERIDHTQLDRVVVALMVGQPGEQTMVEVHRVWDRAGQEARFLGNRFTPVQVPLLNQIQPGDVILVNDFETDPEIDERTRATFKHLGVRSAAILPISTGQQSLGWLLLETTTAPHTFTPEEVRPYVALAGQAAVALESQNLLLEAERRARREQLIREITAKMRASTDLDTILNTAVRELNTALGVSRTFVHLGTGPEPGAQ